MQVEMQAEPHRPREPRLMRMEAVSVGFAAGWVVGKVRLQGEGEPPAAVEVHCDGEPVGRGGLNPSDDGADLLQFAWEAPRSLNDGRRYLLTLHDTRDGAPLEGDPRLGRIVHESARNSFVELSGPGLLRGWVIDPERPAGGGVVELYEDDRLLAATLANIRREDVNQAFAREGAFGFKLGLPASLYDGRRHELAVLCDGRELACGGAPQLSVQLSPRHMPSGAERYVGEVVELSAEGLKGYVVDQRDDTPVQVEVRVDEELAATLIADQYAPGLRAQSGSGYHAFSLRFPGRLMIGRPRQVSVRVGGSDYELPAPGGGVVDFPLVALTDAQPHASAAIYAPPPAAEPSAPLRLPTLRRLLRRLSGEPLVSLVVLNRNGEAVLEALLQSLTEVRFHDRIEVVLIDHGSEDLSRALIERYAERLPIRPILLDANRTFSHSCNLGAEFARGEFIAFVNNDVVFTHDCLAPMRETLDASPGVGLVGAKLLEPRYRGPKRWTLAPHHVGVAFEPLSVGPAGPRLYHPVEVASRPDAIERGPVAQPAVTGALMMVRRSEFLAAGGFDEGYRYGYEDIDLAMRLREQTGKTAVCRLDATAVHNRSATREQKIALSRTDRRRVEDEAVALANRDRFLQRFARRLPRAVLEGLVAGEDSWRETPLRVTFAVERTDISDAHGDDLAAHKLGCSLRDAFGWEVMFAGAGQYDLAGTDVLISASPAYDLGRVRNANPGMIAAAWMREQLDAWLEQGELDRYPVLMTSWPEASRAIMARAGRGAAVLPVVTNLDLFSRGRPRPEYACDVCVVGDAHGEIGPALEALAAPGLPFTVSAWGAGWDQTPLARFARGRARYLDLPDIYASARVVVDARRSSGAERDALNPEVFDALAAGALVLTDCSGDAEEQFGGALPTFSGPDELITLIVAALADSEATAERLGQLRAVVCARHSTEHRARVVQRALLDFLRQDGPRAAIRGPASPSAEGLRRAMAAALRTAGCLVRIEDSAGPASGLASGDEIVVHTEPGPVSPGAANLLYLVRPADPAETEALKAYDQVFAADAEVLDSLRRSGLRAPAPLDPQAFAFDGEAAAKALLRAARAAGAWTTPAR